MSTTVREYMTEIRYRRDTGDPWGSAVGEQFGIASALWLTGEIVPAHWHYRHGMATRADVLANETGEYDLDQYWLLEIETDPDNVPAITQVGEILDRYVRLLDHMGRSY